MISTIEQSHRSVSTKIADCFKEEIGKPTRSLFCTNTATILYVYEKNSPPPKYSCTPKYHISRNKKHRLNFYCAIPAIVQENNSAPTAIMIHLLLPGRTPRLMYRSEEFEKQPAEVADALGRPCRHVIATRCGDVWE